MGYRRRAEGKRSNLLNKIMPKLKEIEERRRDEGVVPVVDEGSGCTVDLLISPQPARAWINFMIDLRMLVVKWVRREALAEQDGILEERVFRRTFEKVGLALRDSKLASRASNQPSICWAGGKYTRV